MAQRIDKISILPFNMVNAFLVEGERGCILVDAGLPGSEAKIAKVLAARGRSLRDITLIVITHAHIDHAGAAVAMRNLTGAPILGHVGDAGHYRREVPMTFRPTDRFGRMFHAAPLIHAPYDGFVPDVLLEGDTPYDLLPHGLDGTIRHTPGHTAGSLSILLAGGDALVGDLIASGILLGGVARNGHAKRPPFEDDPLRVADDLQGLLDRGMARFYMGHGGPLPAAEVRRHIRFLLTLKAQAELIH